MTRRRQWWSPSEEIGEADHWHVCSLGNGALLPYLGTLKTDVDPSNSVVLIHTRVIESDAVYIPQV
jgi:hypothetical protein